MSVNKIILNGQEIELSDEQARRIIGSGNLLTNAQTLIGGVNELDTKVGDGILTTDNKALIGSVNEINEKISVINGNITDINQTITNIGSSTSGAIFKTIMGIYSIINQSINGNETFAYKYSLEGWRTTFEGYKPFMIINGYADNGIIISDMSYNENNYELTLNLYNPYSETRSTYGVHFSIRFIKDGLYIKS